MKSSRSSGVTSRATGAKGKSAGAAPPRDMQPLLPYGCGASSPHAVVPPGSYATAARRERARRQHNSRRGNLLQRVARVLSGKPIHQGGVHRGTTPAPPRHGSSSPEASGGPERGDDTAADDEVLASMVAAGPPGAAQTPQPPLLPPLQAGQVLRDFPFFTQSAEVRFFSTHPSLLDEVFGLRHGQRLRFTRGAWAGLQATVIGARGGAVWVLLAAESVARELPLPSPYAADPADEDDDDDVGVDGDGDGDAGERSASSPPAPAAAAAAAAARLVQRRLQRHYGLEFVPSPQPQGGVAAEAVTEEGFPIELLHAAEAQASRLFTPEQRAFLQRAPDLFVSVVDESSSPEDSDDGLQRSSLSFYQRAVSTAAAASSSASTRTSRANSGRSAQSRKSGRADNSRVVLLSPCVLAASGTLGWGGEGAVMVNGGGVQAFPASLSASIVV